MFFEITNSYEISANKKPEIDAFDLIYRGQYKALCNLIQSGTHVDIRNNKDQTLLHYAILYNQFEIAQFLISCNANLNSIDKFGQKVKDAMQERNFNPSTYFLPSDLNTTKESTLLGGLNDESNNHEN